MNDGSVVNIHAVIPRSRVNGPGLRMVVFFQGCARGCAECFNPDTHPQEVRDLLGVPEIFEKYYQDGIEGITVSGGEPFLQPAGLLLLLKTAQEQYHLTTVVFTGFTFEAIQERADLGACLPFIDVLIDGPYEDDKKEKTLLARGSTNQKFHFLRPPYTLCDFYMPGKIEVTIGRDGMVTETGFSRIPLRQ